MNFKFGVAVVVTIFVPPKRSIESIDWFKGKITGKSHISWENLWFPVDFPLSQPIDRKEPKDLAAKHSWREATIKSELADLAETQALESVF